MYDQKIVINKESYINYSSSHINTKTVKFIIILILSFLTLYYQNFLNSFILYLTLSSSPSRKKSIMLFEDKRNIEYLYVFSVCQLIISKYDFKSGFDATTDLETMTQTIERSYDNLIITFNVFDHLSKNSLQFKDILYFKCYVDNQVTHFICFKGTDSYDDIIYDLQSIPVSNLDFINNESDYELVRSQLEKTYRRGIHYWRKYS